MEGFDAIVIGSGQGGDPLARALARSGKRTALIERAHVGGSCVNFGCTPTKTLYNSARVAYLANRATEFGLRVPTVEVKMPAVRKRVQGVVLDFREGAEKSLTKIENLELIHGQARFIGERQVAIESSKGNREVQAPWIFIDTGTRATVPKIPGLSETPFLDNKGILDLNETPKALAVLGGGPIGLEFAQIFRRLGSEVTVLERAGRLLEREDPDLSEAVAEVLREDGIEIRTGVEVKEVSGTAGAIALKLSSGELLSASHLLLSIGQTPNTNDLGLDATGVTTDERGFIRANERLETSCEGVFAIGDVKGGPAFTHIAYDDFRILEANLLKNGSRTTNDRPVPYVVYLDPQLGRIGPTEAELKRAGQAFRSVRLDATHIARAIEMSETRGFVKAAIDPQSGQILSATAFCVEGGELMACIQVAIMAKLPYQVLKDAVFAHPSLAESLNNLFMKLEDQRS